MDAVTTRSAGPVQWAAQVRDFVGAVRQEMRKVTWPSREELIKSTRVILVLSVVLGLIIGVVDLVLNFVLVDGVAWLTR